MQAKLVTWTPNPMSLVYHAYHHEKHGLAYPKDGNFPVLSEEQWEEAFQLLLEGWCPALEIPIFMWSFRVNRAFHAQLRVHRHWSCWSESHQLVKPTEFAAQRDYFEPPLEPGHSEAYQDAMWASQESYNILLNAGLLPSVARATLPMAINLGLTAGINLRALKDTIVMRRCHIFQGLYWNPLLEMMKDEIVNKVDPGLARMFNYQPCDLGPCLSTIEQEQRVRGEDPHEPCPRYMEIRKTQGSSNCCGEYCAGCLKAAVRDGRDVKRSTRH